MASTLPVDFFGRVAYILQNYSASLGRGVLNTMIIAVLATLAGCVHALRWASVQASPRTAGGHLCAGVCWAR